MKRELFRCEVGVLLDKDHPEFGSYSAVYTKAFGFYDENVAVFLSCKNAKKYGDDYIKEGVEKTYCVIASGIFDITVEDIDEIKSYGDFEGINEFGFAESDMIYFAYKDGTNIKTVTDRRNS